MARIFLFRCNFHLFFSVYADDSAFSMMVGCTVAVQWRCLRKTKVNGIWFDLRFGWRLLCATITINDDTKHANVSLAHSSSFTVQFFVVCHRLSAIVKREYILFKFINIGRTTISIIRRDPLCFRDNAVQLNYLLPVCAAECCRLHVSLSCRLFSFLSHLR